MKFYVLLSGLIAAGCASGPEEDRDIVLEEAEAGLTQDDDEEDEVQGVVESPEDEDLFLEVGDESLINFEYGPPCASGNDAEETGCGEEEVFVPGWPDGTDPFADFIVSFEPGPDAGFGWGEAPDIVLGWPEGLGAGRGSLDVLSLGESGVVVLEMSDLLIVDGPGPDLLVFENPFAGWLETGAVAVSNDGVEWFEWPCEADNEEALFPGCAGVGYVYADSSGALDPTDPDVAGGDAFDLADLGIDEARFVRIRDTGFNAWTYGGTTGGFDLDAIAAVNWRQVTDAD